MLEQEDLRGIGVLEVEVVILEVENRAISGSSYLALIQDLLVT